MCILCNCGFDGPADEFLGAFEASRRIMKRATEEMGRCARIDRRYDKTHKRMVRLMRDWNRIEQERERPFDGAARPESHP
jgi:hypothetical protein